ncbi:MAG: hypothetical protein ACPL3B_06495 [Fervidobacterium sp.]
MDEVGYLLAILEEQALEGKISTLSKERSTQILKERNLSELGASQAIEIGKLSGSKYAVLLTLTELTAARSIKSFSFETISRYTIKYQGIQ